MTVEDILAEVLAPRSPTGRRIDLGSTFVAAGGESLCAMRVIARIRERMGVDVTVGSLLRAPSMASFADAVRAEPPGSVVPGAGELAPAPRSEVPTPAQRGLWFMRSWVGQVPAYNIAFSLALDGPLDAAAFEAAFAGVVRRHRALQTGFRVARGELRTVDLGAAAFTFTRTDARAADLDGIARGFAGRPFDLAAGPLLRGELVRLSPASHTFLLAMHHVAADAWSVGIVLEQLLAEYERIVAGADAAPDPDVTYADFAAWQERLRASGALEAQLAHWRRALDGMPFVLELPSDNPRPPVQRFTGARVPFRLDEPLTAALADAATRLGATLHAVLLAAFGICLSRHTGERRFLVGVPVTGRTSPALETVVGLCANALPIAVDLSDGCSFGELVVRVQRRLADALDHQDLPFDELVEGLRVPRDLARNPLVQVFVGMHDRLLRRHLSAAGISARLEELDAGGSAFDLTVFVNEREPAVAGAVEYSTALFERSQVEGLVASFVTTARSAVATPLAAAEDLDAVSPAERHRQLVASNRTDSAYPRRRIEALFAERARSDPDRLAVRANGAGVTYGELDERAGELARRLRALGVRPGGRVVLCLERGVAPIAAMLAVLECGAAYVPVDPGYPAARIDAILDRVRPAAVVTTTRDAGRFAAAPLLLIDAPDAGGPGDRPGPAVPRSEVDGLAYVAFTSGSTGVPKGVCVPHRAVVRLVVDAGYVELGPGERILQLAPLAFDATTFEVWGALLAGASLHVCTIPNPSPAQIAEFIRAEGVTTAWLTSAVFELMVEHELAALGGLRQLLTGGDVVSSAHAQRLLSAHPEMRLVNGYGPTENTTFTTTYGVPAGRTLPTRLPIGRPISGTRVYVLDRRKRLLPAGAAGELHVAGDGLAAGYLDEPELTAERFVPGTPEIPERLYATGDVVRFRADGELDFLGRRDEQVKVLGHRVELEEVRQALLGHPDVRDAAVLVEGDTALDKHLVAAVVPFPRRRVEPDELRAFLLRVLPAPMVPASWYELATFPVSANGKLDRDELCRLLRTQGPMRARTPEGGADPDAASGTLAAIWRSILGHERFGPADDFFNVGGTSLRAALLVDAVKDETGVELPLQVVFEQPTLGQLDRELRLRLAERASP